MTATIYKIKTNIILILGFVILIFSTYAAYSGIYDQKFLAWDDILYVLKNKHIQSFSFNNIGWMFTEHAISNWHPITWLTYALNFSIWGKSPASFKFVNVTFHIVNSLLVYLLTFKTLLIVKKNNPSYLSTPSSADLSIASFSIAAIFAAHPLHVESVSWISERKDVLSAFFFLATLISYLKYKTLSKNNHWLLITLCFYICSLMSKPMGVTTPIVLILLDIYLFNDRHTQLLTTASITTLLKDKITFFIISLLVSLITIVTQWHGIGDAETTPLISRIINACMSITLYLYHFLIPINLSPFYPYHHWSTHPSLYSIIPVLVVAVITGYCVYLYKKNIYFPLIVWLYFLITLLPVIGIVKVGWQAAADRYTYLPMLSIYIMIGAGVASFINRFKHSRIKIALVSLCAIIYVGTLFIQTHHTNRVWRDDEILWKHVISRYPGTATIAYENLGTAYIAKGEFRKSVDNFSKALALEPRKIAILKKLGKAYHLLNEDKLALTYYREIIRYYPNDHQGYVEVGDFYYRQKQLSHAKKYYRKAYQLAPNLNATLQRSALVDYLENNYALAIQKLDILLKLSPNDIGGLQLAAKVNLSSGDKNKAETIAKKILDLKPEDSFAIQIINDLYSNRSQ